MRAWSTIVASRPCPMGNDCLYGKADAKGLQRLSNTNTTMTRPGEALSFCHAGGGPIIVSPAQSHERVDV